MTPPAIRFLYLVAAVVIAVVTSTYVTWRYLNGAIVSAEVLHIYGVVTGILVVTWLVTDPRIPAAQRPSFDHGMLMWATFPIFAAYQMYSAHRWRGIVIILGLFGLWLAPDIAVAMVYAFGQ